MQLVTRYEMGRIEPNQKHFSRKTMLFCESFYYSRVIVYSRYRDVDEGYITTVHIADYDREIYEYRCGRDVSYQFGLFNQYRRTEFKTATYGDMLHEKVCEQIASKMTTTPEFYLLAAAVFRGDQTAALALADAVCSSVVKG